MSFSEDFLSTAVVKRIFGFLNHSTLLTCRLVSPTWKSWATPLLQPTSKVNVNRFEANSLRTYLPSFRLRIRVPLSRVCYSLLGQRPSAHFLKFIEAHADTITDFELSIGLATSGSIFFEFFTSFILGPCLHLSHLALLNLHRLHIEYYEGPPTLHADAANRLRDSLKSLWIYSRESFVYGNPVKIFEFLDLLLSLQPPQLTSIRVDFEGSRELLELFLQLMRTYEVNLNLRELWLDHAELSRSGFDLLLRIPFPDLRKLQVDSIDDGMESRLSCFLSSVKDTLEELVLEGTYGHQATWWRLEDIQGNPENILPIRFPQMDKLRSLKNFNLEGFHMDFRALRLFPRLVKVEFRDWSVWANGKSAVWSRLFPELGTGPGTLSSIRAFRTYSMEFKGSSREMHYMSVQLRELKIGSVLRPDKMGVQPIFRILNTFPLLSVFETRVSLYPRCVGFNQVIAALSSSLITRLRLGLRECSEFNEVYNQLTFTQGLEQNIKAFKRLQNLELVVEEYEEQNKCQLSLDLIKNGFLESQTLTALTLEGFSYPPLELQEIHKELESKLLNYEIRCTGISSASGNNNCIQITVGEGPMPSRSSFYWC